jgi:putative PIN family toxin of toxin-antitoxin system
MSIDFSKFFFDKLIALNDFHGKIQFTLFKTPRKIDKKKFPYIRDKKDLLILAAAILSDADILITGDKDFDDISLKRPLIFSPNQYFDLINK